MRLICTLFLSLAFGLGLEYVVTPYQSRGGGYAGSLHSSGKIAPRVIPPIPPSHRHQTRSLGVNVVPPPSHSGKSRTESLLNTQVSKSPNSLAGQVLPPLKVNVAPPPPIQRGETASENINIQVYPPTIPPAPSEAQRNLGVHVGPSRPITQDMMFYKTQPPKMKLAPRSKPRPIVVQVVQQKPIPDEYEGEDNEPLFIRNRKGVMIGAGLGMSIDRMWIGGSGDSQRFYDVAFSYSFRLGYQYYFVDYLGLRTYAQIGDWSNAFHESFFDGKYNVDARSMLSLNYSFYLEVLYDFLVMYEQSFGVFGGFGVGVGYGEFSNNGTDLISDYYAIPIFSVGFAYTLFENNRFELEFKIPMRSEILQKNWRTELSTCNLGLSYTYIF